MTQVIMTDLRDRIEMPDIFPVVSRFDPTPEPYILHIREQFNDDGTVTTIHRKRIYDSDRIVDESV